MRSLNGVCFIYLQASLPWPKTWHSHSMKVFGQVILERKEKLSALTEIWMWINMAHIFILQAQTTEWYVEHFWRMRKYPHDGISLRQASKLDNRHPVLSSESFLHSSLFSLSALSHPSAQNQQKLASPYIQKCFLSFKTLILTFLKLSCIL